MVIPEERRGKGDGRDKEELARGSAPDVPMAVNLQHLALLLSSNQFELSQHAEQERQNDQIRIMEIRQVAARLELIEDYPTDPRGASCLVGGATDAGRFLHLICGNLHHEKVLLITLYDPSATDPANRIWEPGYRVRRRR